MNKSEIKIFNITKESSFQLWQSLITVNGFFITLLLGLTVFYPINNIEVKYLVILSLLGSFFSSILLVDNFYLTKEIYKLLIQLSDSGKSFSKEEKKNNLSKALKNLKKIESQEKWALIIQLLIFLLLLVLLIFFLDLSRKPIAL